MKSPADQSAAPPQDSRLQTQDVSPGLPIHDCWNLIGVTGDRTCRELVKFTHCRNCPVYEAAATRLLDRPLPEDYRRESANYYSQQQPVVPATRLSVVIFRLANDWLALPTSAFLEVAERRPLHSLPHRRSGLVLGLVNVRGELLICVSVTRLLGMEQAEVSNLKSDISMPSRARDVGLQTSGSGLSVRLLVTSWEGGRLAFPVDEIHGIQRFSENELKPPPAAVAGGQQTEVRSQKSEGRAPTTDPRALTSFVQGVFGWRGYTVGLLEADSFFAALNRNLT